MVRGASVKPCSWRWTVTVEVEPHHMFMHNIDVGIDGWLVLADSSQQVSNHLLATSIAVVGWVASVNHIWDRTVVAHHISVRDDDNLGILPGVVLHHASKVSNASGGVGNARGPNRKEHVRLTVLVKTGHCPI